MYNKIILAGNLTRDIEIKYTQSGAAIGNTAIATSRKFKSQAGEQKEEVLFVDITFFGRTAEVANQYLRKGSKVLVDGRLKLDQWTAQDGSKRSKHSVTVENMTMLGGRDEAQSGGYNAAPANDTYSQPAPSQEAPSYGAPTQPAPQQSQASNIPEIDINEDEIPF
ncbi:MAG: single-stranded DNA-binding protein [Campylobacterota bacterium]|nr:single-stranded DNA-binding protein [Campylobacterota bacterium]